jgi:type IV secretion system protein VirD4
MMYHLSRLALVWGLIALFYCIVLVVAMTAPLSVIVVVVGLIGLVGNKTLHLSAFGTARVSDENELRKARMIGAHEGLILGRLPANPRWRWLRAMGKVLIGRIPPAEACHSFLDLFRKSARKQEGELVRIPQAVHTAVFAPTGVGKGVSCVIPFLLTCRESCVVIDFKGDLASQTAEHRRRMGHEIIILDPYKVVTQ